MGWCFDYAIAARALASVYHGSGLIHSYIMHMHNVLYITLPFFSNAWTCKNAVDISIPHSVLLSRAQTNLATQLSVSQNSIRSNPVMRSQFVNIHITSHSKHNSEAQSNLPYPRRFRPIQINFWADGQLLRRGPLIHNLSVYCGRACARNIIPKRLGKPFRPGR